MFLVFLAFISLLSEICNGKKRRNHLLFSALKAFITFLIFLFVTVKVNNLSLSDLAFLSFVHIWLEDHVEQSDVSTKKIFAVFTDPFCIKYQILKIHAYTSPTIKRWCSERNQIMKNAKVQSWETNKRSIIQDRNELGTKYTLSWLAEAPGDLELAQNICRFCLVTRPTSKVL